MSIRIEGLISKKVVKGWLEDWESLQSGSPPVDGMPKDSSGKAEDGVSNSQINRIMMDAAVRDLPPVLYVCLKYRWIDELPLGETLKRTGIPKSTYYRRCDKAVDFIYYHVNGEAAGIKALLEKLSENKDD